MAVPLLALGAIARLSTLDDAESVDGPSQPFRWLGLGGGHPANPRRLGAAGSAGLGDHRPRRDLWHRAGHPDRNGRPHLGRWLVTC